ncbi:MAG: aldo/keto reductase [Methanomassiliicoccus sp.]|nr:aldo/keto reductase [Methanomassiliicoccus sp.]
MKGPRDQDEVEGQGTVPRRPLGRTGVEVSAIGLGGYHIGIPDLPEKESVRIIRTAIDSGIDFLDNSWDYNQGESERRMGVALEDGYRDRAFLMTKIDGRDRRTARRQLDESMDRLRTDIVDLLQFHEIIRHDDPDRVLAAGGALEAALEARDDGLVRFIGFTGHKSPDMHNHMLDLADDLGFRFDTLQMPLNLLDAHFDSFERQVLPRAVEKGMGVLGMKPLGAGMVLESGDVSPTECIHYAMSLPTSVVITGCDSVDILKQAIAAGRTFRQFDEEELDGLRARTARVAAGGSLETYKTGDRHDSTVKNPQWLGSVRETTVRR